MKMEQKMEQTKLSHVKAAMAAGDGRAVARERNILLPADFLLADAA